MHLTETAKQAKRDFHASGADNPLSQKFKITRQSHTQVSGAASILQILRPTGG
jgi:hypothetical protein